MAATVVGLVLAGCSSGSGSAAQPTDSPLPVISPVPTPTASSTPSPTPTPSAAAATMLAVGDIGDCRAGGDRGAATAALASRLEGPIALLGDIAYPDGTQANYDQCFWPAWGSLKARSRAVIGNHDDRNRSVFYATWPRAGTSSKPWYSYEVGSWLVLAVDANCTTAGCTKGSPQVDWLKATLAANKDRCTLLTMHQPRFSSDDEHGDSDFVDDLWRTAYAGGIDLVVAGHAHDYERIGPVGATGHPDRSGPVLLVVGTGGTARRGFATVTPASRVRIDDTWGVARLSLAEHSWLSEFIAAPSGNVRDRARGTCR